VEKIPPQSQSVPRVAAALGAVGHLSLLALAQNLVVLWLISRVASSALAAFCGFVAISLIIDLGFFFTFFVAMLSVDSRKYGLQDTFEEVRQRYEDEESTEAALVSRLAQQQRRDIKQRPKHAASPYPRVSGTVAALLFLFMLHTLQFSLMGANLELQEITRMKSTLRSIKQQIRWAGLKCRTMKR
jgi:Sterol-sensing domain of SREBP cleavage-activation